MDYDELVRRLRAAAATWEVDPDELADAITKLRAERDNAIAECVMHIGNAKALRDRLNWFEEAGGVAMATRIYQVIGERDALAGTLAAARAERDAYRKAMAQMNAPAIAMAALRPAPPIIMPAQDWKLHQEINTLNERIAYLESIRIAAQELVNNAEEYECDGLGLFAQHGWWEPLHDALDPDGSATADDIRQPVAPAK